MKLSRISILIPVFNEVRTLHELLAQVDMATVAGLEKELIIVDDGSTDGTREILEQLDGLQTSFRVVFHGQNMGKGAAIRTALTYATGDLVLIQDADLEYDPRDYEDLVAPILRGRADVVYGSRLRGGKPVRDFSLLYLWGNKFVTLVTNVLYGAALTDMETGYKLFRADVIKNLHIRANRFDFEPEFTAKILKRNIRIFEVPITFNPRDYSQGKKIRMSDAFWALWTLLKYRFVD